MLLSVPQRRSQLPVGFYLIRHCTLLVLLDCWLHFWLIFLLPPFLFIHTPINFPDTANHTSGINSISNQLSEPTQHSSPATVAPVSPMATSPQTPSEDQQSFVTLTPPLAFSLDGGEYLLSLAEDEGITDLFSSVDLDQLPLDMPLL